MGMYDSILMKVKCPYCGHEEERECQTKEFSRMLNNWKVGDYVDDSVTSFEAIAGCYNPDCKGEQPVPVNMKGEPYHRRYFHLNIRLKRGHITGKYRII